MRLYSLVVPIECKKWIVALRVLLLHETQNDLPAVESVLAAHGYRVRGVAVNELTLQDEIERWNPQLILMASDDAARDVMEQVCVVSQFRERPIIVFTENDDPIAMWRAMQARMSACAVAGLNAKRLRSVIDVTLERIKLDQHESAQLSEARRLPSKKVRMSALSRRPNRCCAAVVRTSPMRTHCCAHRQCRRVVRLPRPPSAF